MYSLIMIIGLWLVFNYLCWRYFCRAGKRHSYNALGMAANTFVPAAMLFVVVQPLICFALPTREIVTIEQLAAMPSNGSPTGFFVRGVWHGSQVVSYYVLVKHRDGTTALTQIDWSGAVSIVADTSLQHYGRWTAHCRQRVNAGPVSFWILQFTPRSSCDNVLTVPAGLVLQINDR